MFFYVMNYNKFYLIQYKKSSIFFLKEEIIFSLFWGMCYNYGTKLPVMFISVVYNTN